MTLDRSASAKDDWDQHWEQYAESAERNPAQQYRRRLIVRRLSGAPANILDIGSGQGDMAFELRAKFPQATIMGLEGSGAGVRAAESKVPGALFVQRDLLVAVDIRPEQARWATHAVCSEVLEHVDVPTIFLRNCQAYMRPGCSLIVTVPRGPMSAFDRHIGHRKHYQVAELRDLLEQAGFTVQDVAAAGFPFFNLYRVLVMIRGKKLISEVSSGNDAGSSLLARALMSAFRVLFRFNLPKSPWGWQLIATARMPG